MVGKRTLSILMWLALSTGLAVSIFTVVDEMCLATACSDAASFTFFGVGMGWLGIAYFSFILILLWLRNKIHMLDWVLSSMVFSGIGAELRLIWIQKYIIGSWCPLCVTICSALFVASILLVIEKIVWSVAGTGSGNKYFGWIVLVVSMIVAGLAIAVAGVKALT